jgi:hypothetical protein
VEPSITREEFRKRASAAVQEFAESAWAEIVDAGKVERADEWMREHGSQVLRKMLGDALTARSDRLRRLRQGTCSCGQPVKYLQRKPVTLHSVLAGRDVDARIWYGHCAACGCGVFPLLRLAKVDAEGFTRPLREMALLAGVIEPYGSAQTNLLGRFAGIEISRDKIQAEVVSEGRAAESYLKDFVAPLEPTVQPRPIYVEMDGGMVHVDKRWQEVKLGCLFREEDRVETSKDRGELVRRHVVAVRGTPEQLWELLEPKLDVRGDQLFVVLGDGAAWIWNLAQKLKNRVEILDWYHATEHIGEVARALYGEGTPQAEAFREKQLDRLAEDQVEKVIESFQFLANGLEESDKRELVDRESAYLERNQERMKYRTFRKLGYDIGSGAVESAVHHVVQQRMKRVGMRWSGSGADPMLNLRALYRTHGAWDEFLGWRAASAA